MAVLYDSIIAYRVAKPAVKVSAVGSAKTIEYVLAAALMVAMLAVLVAAGIVLAVAYLIAPKRTSQFYRQHLTHR